MTWGSKSKSLRKAANRLKRQYISQRRNWCGSKVSFQSSSSTGKLSLETKKFPRLTKLSRLSVQSTVTVRRRTNNKKVIICRQGGYGSGISSAHPSIFPINCHFFVRVGGYSDLIYNTIRKKKESLQTRKHHVKMKKLIFKWPFQVKRKIRG